MTSADGSGAPNLSVGSAPSTQFVEFQTHTPGVGMTTEHYTWIRSRIQAEVKGTQVSSIWLALAIGTGGWAFSLFVAVVSASMSNAAKGKVEIGIWALVVFTAVFAIFHMVQYKDADRRATALITDMDMHRFTVAVPPAVEGSTGIGTVEVLHAGYGPSTEPFEARKDVTEAARDLIVGGKLDFIVSNDALGGDPNPLVPKVLEIRYRLGSDPTVYRREFVEGTQAVLP